MRGRAYGHTGVVCNIAAALPSPAAAAYVKLVSGGVKLHRIGG